LVWYPARPDAPLLGRPSVINSLYWEEDREDWLPTSAGEVYGEARDYNHERVKPTAVGIHFCGTDSDWENGGTLDDSLPDVEYGPDGLPLCCGSILAGTGGVGIGGAATVTFTPALWPSIVCADAPTGEYGVEYSFTSNANPSAQEYFRWPPFLGFMTVTVTTTGIDNVSGPLAGVIRKGGFCSGFDSELSITGGAQVYGWTGGGVSGPLLWVGPSSSPSVPYTIRIDIA